MRCLIRAGWCRNKDTIDLAQSQTGLTLAEPHMKTRYQMQLVSRSAIPLLTPRVKRWNMRMTSWMTTTAFNVPSAEHHPFVMREAIRN